MYIHEIYEEGIFVFSTQKMVNNMKKTSGSIILIVVAILVIGVLGFISLSNGIIKLEEDVNAAWAEINNQLQRRYDLIPNLVNTVKGYAAHEEDIFLAIADARARLAGASTPGEVMAASDEIENVLGRLLVIVENYPTLQADQSFRDLMYELSGTENRIAVARGRYNDAVRAYNVKIRTFPASLIASMRNLSAMDMFEAVTGSDVPPVVSFE